MALWRQLSGVEEAEEMLEARFDEIVRDPKGWPSLREENDLLRQVYGRREAKRNRTWNWERKV